MEIIPTKKIVNRDGIKAVKNGQKANKYSTIPNQKKPDWIRVKATFDKNFKAVKAQVDSKRLNTVCEEGMCPNMSECWSADQHSDIFGHIPSSHTVLSLLLSTCALTALKFLSKVALTRIQSGFFWLGIVEYLLAFWPFFTALMPSRLTIFFVGMISITQKFYLFLAGQ